jgi:phage tail tape-measure protein
MTKLFRLAAVAALVPLGFTSCRTGAGTGAAVGAASGAVVGGPVGAAVGAATGAIIGAAVGPREARSAEAPREGWPAAQTTNRAGFYLSPYTGKLYDLRTVPNGALVRDQDTGKLFRKV